MAAQLHGNCHTSSIFIFLFPEFLFVPRKVLQNLHSIPFVTPLTTPETVGYFSYCVLTVSSGQTVKAHCQPKCCPANRVRCGQEETWMLPWTNGISRNLALLYVFHKCLNHLCRGPQDRTATEISEENRSAVRTQTSNNSIRLPCKRWSISCRISFSLLLESYNHSVSRSFAAIAKAAPSFLFHRSRLILAWLQ